MLSKNAKIIINYLSTNNYEYLPVNVDIKGINAIERIEAIEELVKNKIVKFRDCEGCAVELISK